MIATERSHMEEEDDELIFLLSITDYKILHQQDEDSLPVMCFRYQIVDVNA